MLDSPLRESRSLSRVRRKGRCPGEGRLRRAGQGPDSGLALGETGEGLNQGTGVQQGAPGDRAQEPGGPAAGDRLQL